MRILLAVDGSPYSQAAVEEVARRPWPAGSTIRVLTAIQLYTPPATEVVLAGATLEDVRRHQIAGAEELTRHVVDLLKPTGLPTDAAVREGDPRSTIVDEADEWKADLIVLGSHGRSGVARWLLGSVTRTVVGHASCSVEVVKRRDA